ncbi:probable pleckstrin homology domain-containing family N member 1 isoform X2 [Dunckerocampus dactyliophorus]|uniref:probable pleckstrin homology domain-containing family N member 1 isoform X2 n=1 Tax=Dunckerocampus dactyliophorus TaxID=161453 RepID=UPI0024065776|nr:probable pleckstrin homology domain-containing family N member 1 isoform X2 [Dunckerocampus dactyliophorus]
MGSSMSCVPQHNLTFSSKSFIRRNSSRLFRKKNPQEGQEKSNSIINILCTVTPRKAMSPKDLETIENIKWDPPFPYDPASGWKKSSINVKNYGRLIHSSKVRFRFLHCQDIHDCYLDLFQTHLHFVSNNTPGLTYQGTLPLKELTICNLQQNCNHSQPLEYAFQINGVSLNPIIVYCANQQEMDQWFGLLKENIEANGGTAFAAENCTRVKKSAVSREELRNSINREPIYEWEGLQRDSLGPITYVTKVRLQHMPCQEQSDRLLVMYTSTMIILSEEEDGLFYKGKLPLNMITVTTPCQDVKPNTFMIEGKLINPIVVSCMDRSEFCDWIQHFKAADVPVLSPPPPVYDIIYTPTHRETPQFDRWSGNSKVHPEPLKFSQSGRGSHNLPFPTHEDNPLSPGYSEPLCYTSSRPSSTETTRLGSRTNSVSSHNKPERDSRPFPLRYSSPQRSSYLQSAENSVGMPHLYSTPYSGPHHLEKGPLVKSNSWNTSQTSLGYPMNAPQRHSDMCAPRQPLSPLYDEPCSPEIYALEEARPVESWPEPTPLFHHQQGPWLPPSDFQLHSPPLHRSSRRSLVLTNSQGQALGLDMETQADQRAEAVSRLKLLSAPSKGHEQGHLRSNVVINTSQLLYNYSPDLHSYLQPIEPDDQEIDYDNIWEYDRNTGMIQSTSGIPTHWTGLNSGARGLGAMVTQQKWS